MKTPPKTDAIINAHTHIFNYKDIPPFLARTFIPWPIYLLTYVPWIFKIFDTWKSKIKPWIRKWDEVHRKLIALIKSSWLLNVGYNILLAFIAINSIYYILDWTGFMRDDSLIDPIIELLVQYRLLQPEILLGLKITVIILGIIVAKWLRQLLFKIGKTLFKPLGYLPGKKTIEFIQRYVKIAIIANYKHQRTAFNKLYKMYPPGSKFVVLTMDMTYMNRTPPRNYYLQLEEIHDLMGKPRSKYINMIPFLFVDPRRIDEDPDFFQWEYKSGSVQLLDCKVKQYLEVGHFRGIKIYPAIGYYPFDENLLPLWLYCVQEDIPITTHCTIGTIFYRRRMKKSWFKHPVFKDKNGKPLNTYARKNLELQKNFTHPLNYLVLLDPYYLKIWLSKCRKEIQDLFGYISPEKDLDRNLSKLKINIAHYGGIEQWKKHLENDRLEYAQELLEMPSIGIRFSHKQGDPRVLLPEKPVDLWNKADWYAVISSMMIQYENVYADISYILHTPDIAPLLHLTLENPMLAKKVLFGTDYYVVRNHKSEKEMFAEMVAGFSDEKFDLISRKNPANFLRINRDQNILL